MASTDLPVDDESVLPYISKSRVKEWKTCPRKFYYKYILGIRTPGTFYTKRGTRLHKTYERFHENAEAAIIAGTFDPDLLEQYLPGGDEVGLWLDWVEPFVTNFIKFEERRWQACVENYREADFPLRYENASEVENLWLPFELEAEGNLDPAPVGPYWMGYADVLLHAASVPGVDANDGIVILDYKTGKTPDPKYREDGIFLEGEFYAALFEDEYDVAAVAGYFPMNDDLVVAPLTESRRAKVVSAVEAMVASTDQDDFPVLEQPLCKWGPGMDKECDFYRICSSTWGTKNGPGPTFPDAPDRGPAIPEPEEDLRDSSDGYGKNWLN